MLRPADAVERVAVRDDVGPFTQSLVRWAGASLLVLPFANTFGRTLESEADMYSLKTENRPDALSTALVKTAEYRYPRPGAITHTGGQYAGYVPKAGGVQPGQPVRVAVPRARPSGIRRNSPKAAVLPPI